MLSSYNTSGCSRSSDGGSRRRNGSLRQQVSPKRSCGGDIMRILVAVVTAIVATSQIVVVDAWTFLVPKHRQLHAQRGQTQLRNSIDGNNDYGETEANFVVVADEENRRNNPQNEKQKPDSSENGNEKEESVTFGDIMKSYPPEGSTAGGLVTQSACSSLTGHSCTKDTLAAAYGITHPLDRMALTANGNLQRLVSSYYDAPVHVLVDSCELRHQDVHGKTREKVWNRDNGERNIVHEQVWDRVVHLQVYNQTFCTGTSVVTVRDPVCQGLVESGTVGLGQLFRYLDILPEFELHDAAPKPGGGFWRDYTLTSAELSCRIHEDFCPQVWEKQPLQQFMHVGNHENADSAILRGIKQWRSTLSRKGIGKTSETCKKSNERRHNQLTSQ